MWTKLGPFRTAITDGNISLFASGVCNLSGLEVWTVSQAATNQPPVITSYLLDRSVITGQALSYQFPLHTFMDPKAGAALTYSATLAGGSALPSWLTFNATTRTFSGTPAAANAGFYDLRVTASDGAGGTASDVFMLTVTQPGTTTFYRGINLNGPAITIDGNSWQSGISNPNFTFTNNIGVFENQSVPLVPSTDANRATMIRSSVWGNRPSVTAAAIPNGIYDVYLYVWEDNAAQDFSISVEGALVVNNYNSGAAGSWSKLGPFRTIVGDGNINIMTAGGHACLSGLEIRSVSTTSVAVTGISVSPSSVNVTLGKSVQVGRTITPANATSRSVSWASSNTAVALVNNDGWVTGVATGTATITASINGFSAQTTATVKTTPSSYSTRLKGAPTEKYGVAKSFSVMPGDIITTEVWVKYLDPAQAQSWNAVATNLISTIEAGMAPLSTLVDGGVAGSIGSSVFPFATAISRGSNPGTGPKAYLNYILFDRNYAVRTAGFKRVPVSAREDGTDVDHQRLAFDGTDKIVIAEPGYIYIYLSNENETPVEVYFDDFKATHEKGAIVSTNEYYPFGLTFNSYQRENSVGNRFKFQGQEHIDDLNLVWDSFKWRNYMTDIGRFFNVDPLAEQYVHNSTYAFAENKVITFIELEGIEGLHYSERLNNGGTGHVIEKNVLVLTRQTSADFSDKKNARIERENAARVDAVQTELSDHYSSATNSAGEPVRFQFNVTGHQVANTADAGPIAEQQTMANEHGLEGGQPAFKGGPNQIAPAAIVTTQPTGQSSTNGIAIMVDDTPGATAHEVGHTMMTRSQSQEEGRPGSGGVMVDPPGPVKSEEVDKMIQDSIPRGNQ
ncbi:MAG TPA: putative Ig domain-containing protein [Chryseolinea sp.]|nr:putative Ig domain-containing protein [Chryseolinea sp.]